MSKVTLSESGLALILLENELNNNYAELHRMRQRLEEAKANYFDCCERLKRNQELLDSVKSSIMSYSY